MNLGGLPTVVEYIKDRLNEPVVLEGIKRIDYVDITSVGMHVLLLRTDEAHTQQLLDTKPFTYPEWVVNNTGRVWGKLCYYLPKRCDVGQAFTEVQTLIPSLNVRHRFLYSQQGVVHVDHSNFRERTTALAANPDQADRYDRWGRALATFCAASGEYSQTLLIMHVPQDIPDLRTSQLDRVLRLGYGWNVADDTYEDVVLADWAQRFLTAQTLATF